MLTDTKKLKQVIADSGLKKSHIAKQMGISRASLDNYLKGKTECRVSHIRALSEILHLDPEQQKAIFFADSGA